MIYTLGERRIETAGDDYYVAPDASVIGSVRFGAGASVWFNCVLRGDSDWINLGEGVNIQDGTIIHTDEGEPVTLGARVSVGHRALLHGCTIAESTLIANGAMVLDRVKIGRHCIIAADALVTPGKVIPDGSVVMGSPGQIVRQVNDRDLKMIDFIAEHYRARIKQYKRDLKVDLRSSS
ncbi:MAG: gamma carbonic anhydrase family protein [Steroidobacteraceae bacterium]|jgi:carbonic anhydrase/acetyltransferase-like protein (isoleucine patch superfamily)